MFIVDDGYTSEKLDDKAANWFGVSKKPGEKLKQRVVPLKVYVIPSRSMSVPLFFGQNAS